MTTPTDRFKQTEGSPHPRLTPQSPQTGTSEHDARNDEDKLAENQKDLGVKPNHKTDDMEKSERGTFP